VDKNRRWRAQVNQTNISYDDILFGHRDKISFPIAATNPATINMACSNLSRLPSLTFPRFILGFLRSAISDYGTDVKKMEKNEGFSCVRKLQKVGKS
jgi:hypothetical protein